MTGGLWPQVDGRSHSHHQHTSQGVIRATLDERQGHVSALLHLSASVFGAIRHLRRGGKQGLVRHSQPRCSAQFTSLITPNISFERPEAHLADGPTQGVAMANHRPYLRGFTHVFHYVRCFIYTRTTGISKSDYMYRSVASASTNLLQCSNSQRRFIAESSSLTSRIAISRAVLRLRPDHARHQQAKGDSSRALAAAAVPRVHRNNVR